MFPVFLSFQQKTSMNYYFIYLLTKASEAEEWEAKPNNSFSKPGARTCCTKEEGTQLCSETPDNL